MTTTAPTTNESIALRALELMITGDRGPAVDEVIHPDFVEHKLGLHGPDGYREAIRRVNTTYADLENTPLDVIVAGDKVVARTRMKALHVGPFQEWEPTSHTIEVDQIHIWRIQDGLVAEHWLCMGELSLLRQMGVLDQK